MTLRVDDLPLNVQAQLLTGSDKAPVELSKSEKIARKFAEQLRAHRFGGWIREHAFADDFDGRTKTGKKRGWRFDFALVEHRIAVEIEGLRVQKIGGRTICTGRHSTVEGYREDCRKYAAAIELGWSVLRFVQDQIRNGEAIDTIERVMARRGIGRSQL